MRKNFNVKYLDISKNGSACFQDNVKINSLCINGILRVPSDSILIAPANNVTDIPTLNTNNITGNVTINGANVCLDLGKTITTNRIEPTNGMYVCFTSGLSTDLINEKTPGAGTFIDGGLIKNGQFYENGTNLLELMNHKNIPFGYAGLDNAGCIPLNLFSSNILALTGYWSPAVPNGGTPDLTNPIYQVNGNIYIVSTSGTNNIGNGIQTFTTGDTILYDSSLSKWFLFTSVNLVSSVNTKTGTVVLTTDDIPEMTNLYFLNSRVSANSSVNLNTLHTMITSGNPHNNTPADVGNTIAQWNANKLQGIVISNSSPAMNDLLTYDGVSWSPSAPPGGGGSTAILMLSAMHTLGTSVTFNSPGTFTFTVWDGQIGITTNNVSFSAGSWTFPSSGTYRIMWGAVYQFIFGASVVADSRVTITHSGAPIPTLIAPCTTTFSDRKTCTNSWTGNITVPATGIFQCFQNSAGPIGNYVDTYWITIEKW
jgi:hypothetical protein